MAKMSIGYALKASLDNLTAFGESKHQAKLDNGGQSPKIHSISTLKNYIESVSRFANWSKDNGLKKVSSVNDIPREHAIAYLKSMQDAGRSAYTVSASMAAINKATGLGITKAEAGINSRSYKDITQNRGPYRESERAQQHADQLDFVRGIGCRRESVTRLTPADFSRDNKGMVVSVAIAAEKGGRDRIAPVSEQYRQHVTAIVNASEAQYGPNRAIFDDCHKSLNVHAERAMYARDLYEQFQAEKQTLGAEQFTWAHSGELSKAPEIVTPEANYRGYDAQCLALVSQALGHNRLDVVVYHYMR